MWRIISGITGVVSVLGCLVWVALWFTFSFRAKHSFEVARANIAPIVLEAAPLNDKTKAFLADVEEDWFEKDSEVDGPCSEALRLAGLTPCVSDLVELFTYRMPPYSFWSPKQNERPAVIGMIQGIILPKAVDGSIHVSDDRRLAFVQCAKEVVLVFADDESRLREKFYCAREPVAEDAQESEISSYSH